MLEVTIRPLLRGRCSRSPRFWNFLVFADRVAVRLCYYTARKDACGHVCARVGCVPNCQSLAGAGDKNERAILFLVGMVTSPFRYMV